MAQGFLQREITLVGYGNQGQAWAKNLRDSGFTVRVSGRPDGQGTEKAVQDGFSVLSASSLRDVSGLVALLLPDESTPEFFRKYLVGGESKQYLFAHGFAVTFGELPVSPDDDVILVAPKGIGQKLRENFVAGSGVLGVLGVQQDASGQAWQIANFIAEGLGLARVGVIQSTFKEETYADLFSEQAVLCGAVPRLVEEGIRYLVRKGIDPKIARYECLNELKLIVDMMVEHGTDGMFSRISNAARVGGKKAAEILTPLSRLEADFDLLWQGIDSGSFAADLLQKRKPEKEIQL